MAVKSPDVEEVYAILRGWAVAGRYHSYLELSKEYQVRRGVWFEPHGSWDKPLGRLNERLHHAGAPALSALVVLGESQEPGGGFWGCAPNVPPRPKSETARIAAWSQIVKAVFAYAWSSVLP